MYALLIVALVCSVWLPCPPPGSPQPRSGEGGKPRMAAKAEARGATFQTDVSHKPAFAEWVHSVFARDYAPAIADRARTPEAEARLAALVESSGRDETQAIVIAALRMWIAAQRTDDPRELRAFATESFPDPASYGPRYQLLLAGRLERHANPAVRSKGRALRQRVIAALTDQVANPDGVPPGRLRYWLAYAATLEADAVAVDERRLPQGPRRLKAHMRSFQYRMQGMLMTRAYGTGRRSDWSDEPAMLGAPREFITPLLNELEASARASDARGDFDQAARTREDMWKNTAWLSLADESRTDEIAARFAAAHPGESFDALQVSAFAMSGGMQLPEGTLTAVSDPDDEVPLRSRIGRWHLLYVWATTCRSCEAELTAADALAREFPNAVSSLAVDEDGERIRSYLADRGLTLETMRVPRSVVQQFQVAELPAKIIVSPNGVFFPLLRENWDVDARRILSLPVASPKPAAVRPPRSDTMAGV